MCGVMGVARRTSQGGTATWDIVRLIYGHVVEGYSPNVYFTNGKIIATVDVTRLKMFIGCYVVRDKNISAGN